MRSQSMSAMSSAMPRSSVIAAWVEIDEAGNEYMVPESHARSGGMVRGNRVRRHDRNDIGPGNDYRVVLQNESRTIYRDHPARIDDGIGGLHLAFMP